MNKKSFKNLIAYMLTAMFSCTDLSAYYCVDTCAVPYAEADYLYWKLDETGLDFAGFQNDSTGLDDAKTVDMKYQSGVRGRLGLNYLSNALRCEGEYTYFSYDNKQKVLQKSSDVSLQGLFNSFVTPPLISATSDFKFTFQNVRIQLLKDYQPYSNLKFVFRGGLQGVWFDQDWKVNYLGQNSEFSKVVNNWDYKGGGIHLGFDTHWYLCRNLNLYFNTNGSLYYGQRKVVNILSSSTLSEDVQNFTLRKNHVIPSLQFSTGLQWETKCRSFTVRLKVGYELNMWYYLQEQYRFYLSGPQETQFNSSDPILNNSSVNLQGWVAGLSLEF